MRFLKLRSPSWSLPPDPRAGADWWLARRSLRPLSGAEAAAFEAWRADPANAAAYEELQNFFAGIGELAAEPEMLELRSQALRAMRTTREERPRLVAGVVLGLAAFAVVLGLAYRVIDSNLASTSVSRPVALAGKSYETKLGERHKVRLDDGTVVALNTDSRLEVTYTARRRDVRLLRGEAMFTVAHNNSWPFVVTVGDRRVTAIGTVFNVRRDGDRIEVALVEGRVRVNPARGSALARIISRFDEEELAPGEQLLANEGGSNITIEAADMQRVTSWENGQIIFRDDTLASAAAEFNRYSETKILVIDPRVTDLKLSGVFDTKRPENFIAAVTAFYPVEARRQSDSVTELIWVGGR